jgi:hypothetical protein
MSTSDEALSARDAMAGSYVLVILDDDFCYEVGTRFYETLESYLRSWRERGIDTVAEVEDLAGMTVLLPLSTVRRLAISTASQRARQEHLDRARFMEDRELRRAAGWKVDEDSESWKESD